MTSSTPQPETYAFNLEKVSEPPKVEESLAGLIIAGIQAGTRVFFWDPSGQVVRGFVRSTFRAVDGTPMLSINTDGPGPWGRSVNLPAAGVTISSN
ncbi:hypothetical protein EV421DRAFT_1837822 [Armillaria borealis]|uniref:Uncharacterized protein n=1 Tax=Armillaria borealis TaxID=47425 RepID=A0AA39MIB0_9AGAR|nr:hypothetical protein EV421DRAFT_1837822 [Armillaria borealis]